MRHLMKLIEQYARQQSLFGRWIGHHAFRIGIALYALNVAETAVVGPLHVPHLVDVAWDLGFLVALMWTMLASLDHKLRLCEPCMAEMPLDPAARAERYRRSLSTVHLIMDNVLRFYVVLVVFIVGGSLAKNAGWINELGQTIIYAVPIMWMLLSISRHARLQPWCPKCRRGGGGERVLPPVPVLSR